jgi:hypothetical protein
VHRPSVTRNFTRNLPARPRWPREDFPSLRIDRGDSKLLLELHLRLGRIGRSVARCYLICNMWLRRTRNIERGALDPPILARDIAPSVPPNKRGGASSNSATKTRVTNQSRYRPGVRLPRKRQILAMSEAFVSPRRFPSI